MCIQKSRKRECERRTQTLTYQHTICNFVRTKTKCIQNSVYKYVYISQYRILYILYSIEVMQKQTI